MIKRLRTIITSRVKATAGEEGAGAVDALPPQRVREEVRLKGYTTGLNRIEFVDGLSDDDLIELNNLLDWNSFVVDSSGRRFGKAAWKGKRCEPQVIPDRRIELMNERFALADKHVLEVGCFEGNHTTGLCGYARKVTAIDSRIENVVKTIVRCAFFGYHPTVFKCNVEERPVNFELLSADVMHHIGVLYHLKDPVRHLLDLRHYIRFGVMLDTHYALEDEATETYEVDGQQYRYKVFIEGGQADVFSGMYDHSKWLTLDQIMGLLGDSGFGKVDIVERRDERNGPRVLLTAQKN